MNALRVGLEQARNIRAIIGQPYIIRPFGKDLLTGSLNPLECLALRIRKRLLVAGGDVMISHNLLEELGSYVIGATVVWQLQHVHVIGFLAQQVLSFEASKHIVTAGIAG